MPIAFLLALQASGMVIDYLGTQNQQRLADYGAQIQAAGVEAQIAQTRLQAEDASLQALRNLRKELGAQAVSFAARGQRGGTGAQIGFMTESVGNFNSDERMRRLNLLGREAELRAGGSIAKLNQQATNSKLWQDFANRSIQRIPTSPQAWGQIGKSFGLTNLVNT